ncbi:MAG: ester cyclase [Anaerolineales bacterium]|nr:ester cyclase [Anaerolineales bacterium]
MTGGLSRTRGRIAHPFRFLGKGAAASAFTGGTSTIKDMIADGDKVVSRLTFRGAHTGDLMGIPATGKSVTMSEIIIDRLADGENCRIVALI